MLIKKSKLKPFLEPEIFPEEGLEAIQNTAIEENTEVDIPQDLVQEKINKLVEEHSQKLKEQERKAEEYIDDKIKLANQEAKAMLNEAHLKKEEFEHYINEEKAKLEAEKSKIKEEAKTEMEKAYQEGLEKGKKISEEFKQILGTFHTEKERVLEESQKEIAAIALDVAKKIIGEKASKDSKILEEQIKSSIKKVVKGKGKVNIYLNPSDKKAGEKLIPKIEKSLDPGIDLVLLNDENIDAGSCIIETKGGRFDASFKTQLETIKIAFEEHLNYEINDLPQEEEIITKPEAEVKMKIRKTKTGNKKTTGTAKKASAKKKVQAEESDLDIEGMIDSMLNSSKTQEPLADETEDLEEIKALEKELAEEEMLAQNSFDGSEEASDDLHDYKSRTYQDYEGFEYDESSDELAAGGIPHGLDDEQSFQEIDLEAEAESEEEDTL